MIEPALWHWIAFIGFVLAMLALDLLVLSRGGHEPTFRESLALTAFWTGLAIAFNGLIWYSGGPRRPRDFSPAIWSNGRSRSTTYSCFS